jgi:hypothetical protein
MDEIRDSYKRFFEKYSKKQELFEFGIEDTILIEDKEKAHSEWQSLLKRIEECDSNLYVRKFGKNGEGNEDLKKFYKEIFKINIKFEKNNNDKPTQMLYKCTNYRKNKTYINEKYKTIRNYQVSHVFEKTKNVYCFTAPWNLAFVPRIVDPFTGHESKGKYVDEFQKKFQKKFLKEFRERILEYNKIIRKKSKDINFWIDKNIKDEKRARCLKKEFSPIKVES